MTQFQSEAEYFAAIDLGSNSFHMIIAKEGTHGNIIVIDRIKEMVRLNAALDAQGYLSLDGQKGAFLSFSL
ncbi:MAG: hypothetical protein GKR96_08520 [Gammaproteobacteria bacterium]|nr:hypothetical protein [Gammaproteobacteria bacterium]